MCQVRDNYLQNNARNALIEDDLRPLGKGLKAVQLQFLQSHSSSRTLSWYDITIYNYIIFLRPVTPRRHEKYIRPGQKAPAGQKIPC